MKAPGFWYPERKTLFSELAAKALSPLSWLFAAGTRIRKAFAYPYHSRRPVVCVGNVVAGGAGKTPTVLALAEILKKRGHHPVFVTRGYGGREVLARIHPAQDDAGGVGDEALLLAARAPTWAGRDRAKAIREAEKEGSMILVDDGLQNPNIKPMASILVVDGETGIGNGRMIPAGPLREPLAAALARVSAMVIVGERDRQNIAAASTVPVFRARLVPDIPAGFPNFGSFVAFAGIGHPRKFFATARQMGLKVVSEIEYPDHYAYAEEDIDTLRLAAEEKGARLLTTEKDAVRLPAGFREEVVVLPVRLVFESEEAERALAEIVLGK